MKPVCITLLLLVAISIGNAAPLPAKKVVEFAKSHTGAAAGVVTWTGAGTGAEKKLGGLNAYVATPKGPFKAAVLLITDIFGYKVDNTRVWADNMAKQGFLVVVPDYFKGNPRTKNDSAETFPAWRALFPREQVLKETDAVIADIRKQYPSVKKIGAVGFCWGGLYATLLTAGKTPKVAAALVYHGSLITKEDVLAINAPINFQQSDPELDNQIKTDFYKEIKAILADKAKKGLDASITYYPNQPHGFSLRGGTDPTTTAAATTAFSAGAAFFKKHLQ